uniref:nickel pincer cofactor biosynthesis protein LarC n=1 Tax=Cyanobium sp. TaxID=2164130 RepID=UPI0040499548
MSQLALIDCPTGLAGNMLLAALLDLGLPQEVIDAPLAALGLAQAYRLVVDERRSAGLRGLHLEVELREVSPPHRHWGDLRQQILAAPLDGALQAKVLEVFSLLAEAEAVVHGVTPEQVHFHEVGAVDALVDVVGVCAGLLHFGVTELICSPPPGGHGAVATAHGPLPLPAPAVLEIARQRGVELASAEGFPPAELTTPTGLALVACWADRFGVAPSHIPESIGMGLGSRQLDRANLLRLTLAAAPQDPLTKQAFTQAPEIQEVVLEQQAQIDDATAEDLAFLIQALRKAGAKEVFSQPIAMKKGRTGQLLTVLVDPPLAAGLRAVWWQHSSSLGVRESQQLRWVLPRRSVEIATPLGSVRLKQAQLPDGRWRSKPEHDDLIALASRHNLGLDQVRTIVVQALTALDGELQP